MTPFLLKTKMNTSLERAFRDLHVCSTIVTIFSNGTKFIFSGTDTICPCNNIDTSFKYDLSRLDLHVYDKNLPKPNCWKRKPEPGIWKLQGSGLEKDVFGPHRFLKSEFELTLKKHEKNKKVCKLLEMGI
jgi:hypothetical protein